MFNFFADLAASMDPGFYTVLPALSLIVPIFALSGWTLLRQKLPHPYVFTAVAIFSVTAIIATTVGYERYEDNVLADVSEHLRDDYNVELVNGDPRDLISSDVAHIDLIHDGTVYADVYAVRYDRDTSTTTLLLTQDHESSNPPTPEELAASAKN